MPPDSAESSARAQWSKATAQAVWKSRLPKCLKIGVAGKIASCALDDGTLSRTWTVKELTDADYFGRKLSKRQVQRQLQYLEKLGFLLFDKGAVVSRSRPRVYTVDISALENLDATPPFAGQPRRPRRKRTTRDADIPGLLGESGG